MPEISNKAALTSIITATTAWTILETIANTYAPSQTVSYTRALAIQQLLPKLGLEAYLFDPDYAHTGNALLTLGARSPKILFLAHADEFSYLVGPEVGDGIWSLTPYCSDRTEIDYHAVALRYRPASGRLETAATGLISRDNPERAPYFVAQAGSLQPGDRVIYRHPLSQVADAIQGSLDNAAGVTACLLAVLALSRLAPQATVAFAFTDEEEGPPVYNTTFARGARRLLRRLPMPDLCVNVDGHNLSTWCKLGQGAVFTEQTGQGRGAVVPPQVYARFKRMAADMTAQGVRLTENLGYVSRSDEVACLEMTPNILLLGYPLRDPHFNQGVPAISLADLLDLGQAIFWTAVGFV